eukprot:GHVR01120805.1.p1 GENE.GHVR01120805.1~~GHVR01120805.1.p1  ORF type:complete len:117 (-),score=11.16 GHVR01120805.1:127-477(-)
MTQSISTIDNVQVPDVPVLGAIPQITAVNVNQVVQQQAEFMAAHQAQLGYLIGVQTNIPVNKMVADVAEAKRSFLLNLSETPVSVMNQLVEGAKGTPLQHHSVGTPLQHHSVGMAS